MNRNSVACRGNILSWTLTIQISSAAYPVSYSEETGTIPQRKSDSGLNLRTHLHLNPKLRIYGAIPPLTHVHSWHEKWQIRLHLTCMCCKTTIWERYQRRSLYPSGFGIFRPHISLFSSGCWTSSRTSGSCNVRGRGTTPQNVMPYD